MPDNVAELRAGRWNKKEYSKARGLFGRTLGLIGYGNIGAEVASGRAAFGMPVVVWSRRFARRCYRRSACRFASPITASVSPRRRTSSASIWR